MCSKPPVEACHFSVVHIVWCSEGPCEPSTEYQFTDLDPKPHEIEKRGTDFTFFLCSTLVSLGLHVIYVFPISGYGLPIITEKIITEMFITENL